MAVAREKFDFLTKIRLVLSSALKKLSIVPYKSQIFLTFGGEKNVPMCQSAEVPNIKRLSAPTTLTFAHRQISKSANKQI
ncbi:MAG: hypothetical protein ACK4TA_18280 [Saprospiraceae bacterium]